VEEDTGARRWLHSGVRVWGDGKGLCDLILSCLVFARKVHLKYSEPVHGGRASISGCGPIGPPACIFHPEQRAFNTPTRGLLRHETTLSRASTISYKEHAIKLKIT
jgi:hypothetical protein